MIVVAVTRDYLGGIIKTGMGSTCFSAGGNSAPGPTSYACTDIM